MGNLKRFLSYTERDEDTGCLLWTGGLLSGGYGQFWAEGRTWAAHRWIFKEKHGFLPEAVMHKCDTPRCVDWKKCLKAGTRGENNTDRCRKGRNSDRRGMRNPACKISDSEVRDIAAAKADGWTNAALGKAYGVNPSHISYICNKRAPALEAKGNPRG